jgi:hypothetical protein
LLGLGAISTAGNGVARRFVEDESWPGVVLGELGDSKSMRMVAGGGVAGLSLHRECYEFELRVLARTACPISG